MASGSGSLLPIESSEIAFGLGEEVGPSPMIDGSTEVISICYGIVIKKLYSDMLDMGI